MRQTPCGLRQRDPNRVVDLLTSSDKISVYARLSPCAAQHAPMMLTTKRIWQGSGLQTLASVRPRFTMPWSCPCPFRGAHIASWATTNQSVKPWQVALTQLVVLPLLLGWLLQFGPFHGFSLMFSWVVANGQWFALDWSSIIQDFRSWWVQPLTAGGETWDSPHHVDEAHTTRTYWCNGWDPSSVVGYWFGKCLANGQQLRRQLYLVGRRRLSKKAIPITNCYILGFGGAASFYRLQQYGSHQGLTSAIMQHSQSWLF